MPGLIQVAQPQAVQSQAAQPQTAQPQKQPDRRSVARVIAAAVKIIHDPKVSAQLIEMMKAAGDPVQALAQTTVLVMRMLYEKSNNSIPPEVLGAAGVEVLQLLAQLAQTAKLFDVTMDIFKQAAQASMDMVQQESGATQAAPGGAALMGATVPQPMM